MPGASSTSPPNISAKTPLKAKCVSAKSRRAFCRSCATRRRVACRQMWSPMTSLTAPPAAPIETRRDAPRSFRRPGSFGSANIAAPDQLRRPTRHDTPTGPCRRGGWHHDRTDRAGRAWRPSGVHYRQQDGVLGADRGCAVNPGPPADGAPVRTIDMTYQSNEAGFHVPQPQCRPGQMPDFSTLAIPSAGIVDRPPVEVNPDAIRDHAYRLIRVLDDSGAAVGPWAPRLEPELLLRGLRAMMMTRAYDARMVRVQRQGKTSFYMKSTGEEAVAVAAAMALDRAD